MKGLGYGTRLEGTDAADTIIVSAQSGCGVMDLTMEVKTDLDQIITATGLNFTLDNCDIISYSGLDGDIYIAGHNAMVRNNRISGHTGDGDGLLTIAGNSGLIHDNHFYSASVYGLVVTGSSNTVSDNRFTGQQGLWVYGKCNQIEGNNFQGIINDTNGDLYDTGSNNRLRDNTGRIGAYITQDQDILITNNKTDITALHGSSDTIQTQVTDNKTNITDLHTATDTERTARINQDVILGQATGQLALVSYSTFTILIPFASSNTTVASMIGQYYDIPIGFEYTPKNWTVIANTAGTFTVTISTAIFATTPSFGNSIMGTTSPNLVSTVASSGTVTNGGGVIPSGYILRATVLTATVADQIALSINAWKPK